MACDPYWNQVVLALHMDGTNGSTTFVDEKGKAVTPYGNAQISTAQSKFGSASAYFDGTGDYLSVPNTADLRFDTGDFTVECFVRPTVAPGGGSNNDMTVFGALSGSGYLFFYLHNATLVPYVWDGAAGVSGVSAVPLNAWTHLAFVRASNVLTIYVGGVAGDSLAKTYNNSNSTETFKIGGNGGGYGNRYFNGYIDGLRVTKGVARYTANFTAPTAAYPDNQCVISGVVGSPGNYLERIVRAYRRDTGALIGQAASNPTTGAYSISAQHDGECFAIVHDSVSISSGAPVGGTNNAIIYDRVIPA